MCSEFGVTHVPESTVTCISVRRLVFEEPSLPGTCIYELQPQGWLTVTGHPPSSSSGGSSRMKASTLWICPS
jgi:hypothetical protein